MQVNPYLMFDGRCEAAFQFYEKCLGARIAFKMTFGESPMADQCPPGWEKAIMHAHLSLGDRTIMGSDCPPDRYSKPQGFSVSLNFDAPSEAERVYKAMSENGTVTMPLQETFWAAKFGMFVDQFAIPWMINCEKPK